MIGLEGVRQARALTTKPLVAIGGITRANCRSVIEAGADSVAVISDLCASRANQQRNFSHLEFCRDVSGSRIREALLVSDSVHGDTCPRTQESPALTTSDFEQTEISPRQSGDQEFVKGLGLTSATTLVMGSMIGSGIFIVSAEIAREVESPALLIGAWLVTGFMTIIGALSYGELAAMMPRAGGQYVYLREALGPLWGFLYGWTLFLVIQTGTIAAVGVAFGKFLGVFFPSISSSHWILHFWKVPPIHVGPMVLGNMDVGLNTQNLVAILLVIVALGHQYFRRQDRARMIQNVFTFAKVCGAAGTGAVGLFLGRNAQALAANFTRISGTTPDWARCIRCRSARAADVWWARSRFSRSRRWDRCSPPTPGTT